MDVVVERVVGVVLSSPSDEQLMAARQRPMTRAHALHRGPRLFVTRPAPSPMGQTGSKNLIVTDSRALCTRQFGRWHEIRLTAREGATTVPALFQQPRSAGYCPTMSNTLTSRLKHPRVPAEPLPESPWGKATSPAIRSNSWPGSSRPGPSPLRGRKSAIGTLPGRRLKLCEKPDGPVAPTPRARRFVGSAMTDDGVALQPSSRGGGRPKSWSTW